MTPSQLSEWNSYENSSQFIGNLGNYDSPLYREFNAKLLAHLTTHTDVIKHPNRHIFCHPFGRANMSIHDALQQSIHIESGIGYEGSFMKYRIFESYSILNQSMAIEKASTKHYWYVIPNYYNIDDWHLIDASAFQRTRPIVLFFGRITHSKGLNIFIDIAKHIPDCDFVMCGQGDPRPFLQSANLTNLFYKPPIHTVEDKNILFNSVVCVVCPSEYAEPFCGVHIEAQLCGLMTVTSDHGIFGETIHNGINGYKCHTLADYVGAVKVIILKKGNHRHLIQEWSQERFGYDTIRSKYEKTFDDIWDIFNGGGWYNLERPFLLPIIDDT